MVSDFTIRKSKDSILIDKWQAHILSLLDNPQTYEAFQIKIFDEQGNISPWSGKVSQDIMRFILLTLYYEVPRNYYKHKRYKEHIREQRELNKHEAEFTRQLKYMNSYFIKNLPPIFGFEAWKRVQADKKTGMEIFKDFQEASQNLIEYFCNPLERERYMLDTPFSAENNYLLKREITSKAGIRNLAVRYACLCMQVFLRGSFRGRDLYQFLYLVCSYILNTEEFYLGITREVFDKTIRHINIENPEQGYAEAFEQLGSLDEVIILNMHPEDKEAYVKGEITEYNARYINDEGITRHILKWWETAYTYHIVSNFIRVQHLRYSKKLKQQIRRIQKENEKTRNKNKK